MQLAQPTALHRLVCPEVEIALGGNLGTEEQLRARFRAVVRLLVGLGGFAVEVSDVFTSAPGGPVKKQPRFLNAAVRLRLPIGSRPSAFLGELLAIESALGRRRPSRPAKGPRVIDLDLIAWRLRGRQLHVHSRWLTLPHPEAANRPFVLQPLQTLSPLPLLCGEPFRQPVRPIAVS